MEDRSCISCGKLFSPKCGTQTHCIECSDGRRHKARPKEYVCNHCGKMFISTNGHEKQFCSRSCFGLHRKKEIIPPAPKQPSTCEWCGRSYRPKSKSQKYCCKDCNYEGNKRLHRQQWQADYIPKTHICKECGNEFTTECRDTHSVFCCKSCANKWQRRKDHKTLRHLEYSKEYNRRRERMVAEAFVEDVSYDAVFLRDEGICQICGLPVLKDKFMDPNWSGSIDHILPISKKGEHSMANCQLAHRICNSLKG